MQLKKLDNSFYQEHTHLKEALDNYNGQWEEGKVRGYGVVLVNLNNLTFAIPLRTNIKHTSSYITVRSHERHIQGKGLDFTKALLIKDPTYISHEVFKIHQSENRKLRNKEIYITQKFEKYIQKYVVAVQSEDQNVLSSIDYRYSTLINYHSELGLDEQI